MNEYRRPPMPADVYRDEQGIPIDYGNRWPEGSPPEDAYSRVSNLQRFEPLHAVARALINWLQGTFDVTSEHSVGAASDLLRLPDDVIDAVRVVPRDPAAATLTFVFTGFPGVFLHAGCLHDFHFPDCGCDACDDDAANVADELEWTVRSVVAGGYSERFDRWPGRWVEYRLEEPGVGMHSGRSRTSDYSTERVASARAALDGDRSWSPWRLLHR